jgi:hypothetical protein
LTCENVQNPCTRSELVLATDSGFDLRMTDDQLPDPNTPQWSLAWAAKDVLRRYLGPKYDRGLPVLIADAVIAQLQRSGWKLETLPPNPPHSTFGPPVAR